MPSQKYTSSNSSWPRGRERERKWNNSIVGILFVVVIVCGSRNSINSTCATTSRSLSLSLFLFWIVLINEALMHFRCLLLLLLHLLPNQHWSALPEQREQQIGRVLLRMTCCVALRVDDQQHLLCIFSTNALKTDLWSATGIPQTTKI